MPTWTISAPKYFEESVKETAKKLGLGYGEYLRMAHKNQLQKLTSDDFERAKKLMLLDESKTRLNNLREMERVLLREKAYKDRNVQRILKNIDDPDIKNEILRIAQLREQEADIQLRIGEELNPLSESEQPKKLGRPRRFPMDTGATNEDDT